MRTTSTPSPGPSATTPPSSTPSASASRSATPTPAAQPAAQVRYVAIGASDSVGVGARDPASGSWPARVAALLPAGSAYRNVAVSGSLTEQAKREQLPVAIAQQPTVVTIWLAVNDLDAEVPPADHAASLEALIDALARRTPATVFIGTVPDLRVVPAYAGVDLTALIVKIQAYNAGIAAVAARHAGRAFVVDLFAGSAALTDQLTVSEDGFHPSDAGYALIAQRFADAMRAHGVPLASSPR